MEDRDLGEANPALMRNRLLHDALRDFALESAALLTDDLRDGAEVEFDVIDEGAEARPRALSLQAAHRGLPGRALGAPARAAGLPARGRRARRRRLGLAARERPARRAGRAGAAGDARAPLRGRHELRLPRGALRARLRRGRAHALPRLRTCARGRAAARGGASRSTASISAAGCGSSAARGWTLPRRRSGARTGEGEPAVLCVLERDAPADEGIPAGEAGGALRARGHARCASGRRASSSLGAPGWRRTDERALAAAGARRRRAAAAAGAELPARAGEEDGLREFFAALERGVPDRSAVAGRCGRFEIGCERARDDEALSDYLLGLRALLDATSDAGEAEPRPARGRALRRGGRAQAWCSAGRVGDRSSSGS